MKTVAFLIHLLVFVLPLTFFPKFSEIFEFPKIILVYAFTILIVFFWSLESIKQKKFVFKKSPLTLPIVIFLLSQTIATIISIDPRTSILGYYGRFHGGLLSWVSYAILYFAIVTFINTKQAKGIIKTLLISVSIVAVWAGFEHIGASPSCLLISGAFDTNCFVQNVQERVFSTLGQPNWLAAVLVAAIPVSWAFAMRAKNDRTYVALSLLLFIALLFTKSRSGLLGFAVAFVIFWLPSLKKHFSLLLLTATYCLLATVFVWNPFKASDTPPVEGVTESGDIRRIVWEGAFDLWKKYPILGTGVETFAFSYYETRPASHNTTSEWNFLYNKAHNEYLNFAATTGTVGLAAYAILILAMLKTLLKNKTAIGWALLAGFTSILVTNFFGFSTVTIGLLFFLYPAISLKLK